MSANYYSTLRKDLDIVKNEIKSIKEKCIDVEKLDQIEKKITQEIHQHFVNNELINKCNVEVLNMKISLMTIKIEIEDVRKNVKTLIHNTNTRLNNKLINFLAHNNFPYNELLKKLGCESIEDIILLDEHELVSIGIPLVHSKKMIEMAKKHIESNDPLSYV